MILQGLRHLYGASTIGIGLDHADQFCLGLEERTEIVQVVDNGIQVDFEDGFMHLLFQLLCDLVEAKHTSAFNQDQLIVQRAEHLTTKELVGGGKEIGLGHGDYSALRGHTRADANQFSDASLLTQVVHLTVEFIIVHPTLVDITQNECTTIR